MPIWTWLNANSGAIQSVLALVTILVLAVTWRAIKVQADAARALTKVAIEQTEAIRKQADAALQSVAATNDANRLSVEQMKADLLPILIVDIAVNQPVNLTKNAIRNVGRGPATNVQISIGMAKDEAPKSYIPCRTLIGSGDEVSFPINREAFMKSGVTIHYTSLDRRCFASSVYVYEGSVKHDFEELKP